jgi:hypothetical protein
VAGGFFSRRVEPRGMVPDSDTGGPDAAGGADGSTGSGDGPAGSDDGDAAAASTDSDGGDEDAGGDGGSGNGRRTAPIAPTGGGPDRDAGIGEGGDGDGVDSNWWYWVAAVPVYWVVATVGGFAFALLALTFVVTGAGVGAGVGGGVAGEPTVGVGAGLGIAGLAFVAVALLLAFAGMVVSLVFPVAVYLDAEAVADARLGWEPDPALYGLLGLAGVVAQPLQVPLAVYYLYKRHESVGRP